MDCYRCGADDHLYRDCPQAAEAEAATAPAARAVSYEEHLGRIDQLVMAWHAGKLTYQQKRQAIADENSQWYYGPKTRSGISLTTA